MAEPERPPTYNELVQYCQHLNAISAQRTQEFERFVLSVRRFRAAEQLILLLLGAVSGISFYKLWFGL